MKRCSISFSIREMQTKSTLRGHFSDGQEPKFCIRVGKAIGKSIFLYIVEPRINHTTSWVAIWQYPQIYINTCMFLSSSITSSHLKEIIPYWEKEIYLNCTS